MDARKRIKTWTRKIIPKEIVFDYLRQEFSKEKYQHGFILDGYPKDMESLHFLLPVLESLHIKIRCIIYFSISKDLLIERLTGRLLCSSCELNYHVSFLPPQKENMCDKCGQELTSRSDDKPETIMSRQATFDATTGKVIDHFSHLKDTKFYTIDATKSIADVGYQIMDLIQLAGKTYPQMEKTSYLVSGGDALPSTIFHNHIDGENEKLVVEICHLVATECKDVHHKMYPIAHLTLGSQTKNLEFKAVYQKLPNFHPIYLADKKDEGFSTGPMGDELNYRQLKTTLEVCHRYPGRGVMTEIEQDLICGAVIDGKPTMELIDTRIKPIDWNHPAWEGTGNYWRDKMIDSVPNFELHHGFDVPFSVSSDLPLPIEKLMAELDTEESEFSFGGWFIFRKDDRWAYRSNEFSNKSLEECIFNLGRQVTVLQEFLQDNLPYADKISQRFSLESVHGMWKI